MSGWINRGVSSSIPTGPGVAGRSLLQRITLRFESNDEEPEAHRPLALFLAVDGSDQGQTFDGLLEMLPGVVGEDADDAGGHYGRGHAKDADKRLNLCNFANNLGL